MPVADMPFRLPETGEIRAVARDARGCFYFADECNHRILKHGADGQALGEFGGQGDAPGRFHYPMGLLVWEDRLLVCDSWNHRVQVLDLEGRPLGFVGRYGADDAGLAVPCDLCLGPDGEIWVVEEENGRVSIYDASMATDPAGEATPKKRVQTLEGLIYPHRLAYSGGLTAVADKRGLWLDAGATARALLHPAHTVALAARRGGALLVDSVERRCCFLEAATNALVPVAEFADFECRGVWLSARELWLFDGQTARRIPLPGLDGIDLAATVARPRAWRLAAMASLEPGDAVRLMDADPPPPTVATLDLACALGAGEPELARRVGDVAWVDLEAYLVARVGEELAALEAAAEQVRPDGEKRAVSRDLANSTERISDAGADSRPLDDWLTQRGAVIRDDVLAALEQASRWFAAARTVLQARSLETRAACVETLLDVMLVSLDRVSAIRAELTVAPPSAETPDLHWELDADLALYLLARLQAGLIDAVRAMADLGSAAKANPLFALDLTDADTARLHATTAARLAAGDHALPAIGTRLHDQRSAADALRAIGPLFEPYCFAKYALFVDPVDRADASADAYAAVLAGRRAMEEAAAFRAPSGEVGAVRPPREARDYFRDAAWSGQTDRAEAFARRIVGGAWQDSLHFRYDLARYYECVGDDARAAEGYAGGLENDFWLAGLVCIEVRAGQWQAALQRLAPLEGQPGFRFWRGRALQAAADFPAAIAEFEGEDPAGPYGWQSVVEQALSLIYAGEPAASLARLDDGRARLDPFVHAYFSALARRAAGDTATALAALYALPLREGVQWQRGVTLRMVGRYQEAIAAFDREWIHFPKWPVRLNRAIALTAAGDDAADAELEALPSYAWLVWAGRRLRKTDPGFKAAALAWAEAETKPESLAPPDRASLAMIQCLTLWGECDYESLR